MLIFGGQIKKSLLVLLSIPKSIKVNFSQTVLHP